MIGLLYVTFHKIRCAYESNKYPSPYASVTVDSKEMSLCVQGRGEHTIVLLPGLGTTAPILDFEPLADQLAKNNRVVTVEPFGYGWSDLTDSPRTVQNEVSELREALQSAEIEGPYILMAHSVSGLDAIYYANTYPEEVEAVVGIDCTLPRMTEYFEEAAPAQISSSLGYLCDLGVMRLICMIAPDNFISDNTNALYSKENLQNQKFLASRMSNNTTVINQSNHIAENIELTHDLTFDSNLPILFFTRDDSDKQPRSDHKTSVSFFESYISNPDLQSVVAMNAHHYMHWSKAKEMADQDTADYAVITIYDPFSAAFERIPNAYKKVLEYLQANGFREKPKDDILSCFEH
ncbi:MAG: alpha/beta hydrolase, partial [Clostridia bacterium]|nr:alpha/beta hydrolase [Clostridia bacterium]